MRTLITLGVSVLLAGAALAAPPPKTGLRKSGTVKFPTTCKPSVQADFEDATALLHSFFYDEARTRFAEVAKKDPTCAMAQWGIAMSLYHPIWTPPNEEELAQGSAAAAKALALGSKDPTERAWIQAIQVFYTTTAKSEGPGGVSCHGLVGSEHLGRALAYEKEMEALYAAHPDDVEATAFYALALLGTAPPADKTLSNQLKAAALLNPLFATHRNHPGISHYLIHAYDYPGTAELGLPAARNYAQVAAWVPHALHMPSHIFTRLGMWQDSINSNEASATAARSYAAHHYPAGSSSFEELHALDYLVYANLQLGRDAAARKGLDRLLGMKALFPRTDFVGGYASAAIQARFPLERQDWKAAAELPLQQVDFFDQFPFAEAHLELAHAIGRARLGDAPGTLAAAERLAALAAKIPASDPRFSYFVKHLQVEERAARALGALLQGQVEPGLASLSEAADQEEQLGKHPVTPGAIYPVRELYADALMEQGRPAEALAAYQQSLKISPRRWLALLGAARAADKAGQGDVATSYYQALVAQGDGSTRPALAEAKTFLRRRGAKTQLMPRPGSP